MGFFTPDGQLIPTPEESAAEQQVVELESLLVRYRERFGELPG